MYDVNTMQFYGVDKTLLFEAVSEPRRKQPTQRRPTIIDGYTCWELAMVDADAVGRRFIELLLQIIPILSNTAHQAAVFRRVKPTNSIQDSDLPRQMV